MKNVYDYKSGRICKDRDGKWVLHYYVGSTIGDYRSASGKSKAALVIAARAAGLNRIVFGLGHGDPTACVPI